MYFDAEAELFFFPTYKISHFIDLDISVFVISSFVKDDSTNVESYMYG